MWWRVGRRAHKGSVSGNRGVPEGLSSSHWQRLDATPAAFYSGLQATSVRSHTWLLLLAKSRSGLTQRFGNHYAIE